MKNVNDTLTSAIQDTSTVPRPIKVCMHVHNIVRIDPRVMREATALVREGFAVTVVDIEGDAKRPKREEISGVCLRHVIMPRWYISTPFPWSLIKAAIMFLRTTFRVLFTTADIYHAHDVQTLPTCYIAARLRRKPLIFDSHEMPLSEMPLSAMSRSRRSIHPLLTRLFVAIIPHCVGVIATSSNTAQVIRKCYQVPEVTLVRNFPPYRAIQKSDRLHRLLGLNSDILIALYQGYLQPDRELHRFVRAAAFLESNIMIVLMGQNVGTTQSELEALISSEGAANRVKIIPRVPYEELLDWTASADIGLISFSPDYAPDHMNACLPNKLFEYLMAGLPVLSAELDAIAQVIRSYNVGKILPSLDPMTIGASINAMLADHVSITRMSQNGLKAAQEEFNWEKESLQLLGLYHDILITKKKTFRKPQIKEDIVL